MARESGESHQRKRKGFIQMLKTEYRIADKVPASAIYECSECESITAFKKGETFLPCDDCQDPTEEQTWYRTNEFVRFVSRNVNTEFERIETLSIRTAEFIAEISGNVWFVYLHLIWFAFWIYVNTGHELLGIGNFDPYPFGFLTMVVSLEAIFLSTFILIAQNLQAKKAELRAELDYQTNIKAEKGVAEIISILHELKDNGSFGNNDVVELARKGIILRPTKKKNSSRHRHSAKMLSDAGIDVVHPHSVQRRKKTRNPRKT